jgi:hypothetical protein
MNGDRRQFNLALTSALLSLSAGPQLLGQTSEDHSSAPSGTARAPYFFKNPTFEVIFLTSLGRSYYSGGNIGKVLYLTRQVEDGNFESAFLAFKQAGDEARAMAEDSASRGHKGFRILLRHLQSHHAVQPDRGRGPDSLPPAHY